MRHVRDGVEYMTSATAAGLDLPPSWFPRWYCKTCDVEETGEEPMTFYDAFSQARDLADQHHDAKHKGGVRRVGEEGRRHRDA